MRDLFNNKKVYEFNPSIFRIIIVLGLINFFCYSCMWTQSNLNQITSEEITCDVNKSKATAYYNKYGNKSNIAASDSSVTQKAFEKLSNIPEEYLEFVLVKHNTTMEIREGKAEGGVTYLYGSGSSLTPNSIYSEIWCLGHEFGHASEGYVHRKYSGFGSDLSKISQLIADKYQSKASDYLNTYAYSDPTNRDAETFAELFDTWYCSAAARNKLKSAMPEVYDLAKKYLLPPNDGGSDIDGSTNTSTDKSSSDSTSTTDKDNDGSDNDYFKGFEDLLNNFSDGEWQ